MNSQYHIIKYIIHNTEKDILILIAQNISIIYNVYM